MRLSLLLFALAQVGGLWIAGAQEPAPAEKPPVSAEKPPVPAEKPPVPAEKPPVPAEKPAPALPYAVEPVSLPAALAGKVAAIDFSPQGDWMLLGRDGAVMIRPAELAEPAAWQPVSDQGLEGASGLYAGYWPKSLIVVQNAGISRLFDTDGDGRVDFVKAVAPVWQFGTIGVLFQGSPLPLADGDLLLPPRIASGPLAGAILRLPESGPPVPWLTGHRQAAAPRPGPAGGWLVAGIRPLADAAPADGEASGAISVVAPPTEPTPAPAAPPLPDEAPKDEKKDDQSLKTKAKAESPTDSSNADAPPPAPAPKPPVAAPVAVRVPAELLTGAPLPPAYPPDELAADADFGPFSGQGFLAGETSNRLLRFWLEEVDGSWQGGITDFATFESPTPGLGLLRFTPAGTELLAGQNGQLFGIRPASGAIFAVRTVHLASDGFEVTFTAPIDRQKAIDPTVWKIARRPLDPAAGSAEAPVTLPPATTRFIVSADGLSVTVQADFAPGGVYRLDLSGIPSESGAPLAHGPVWYTLHKRRPAPAPEPEPESKPEPTAPATPAPLPSAPGAMPNPAPATPASTPEKPAPTATPEAPKAEAPKAEAPKAEAPKADAPKADAPLRLAD
ncbi:MAG: hypothetical protein JNK37_02660 [Verrucomicrobiales bacterium]|nr:hypothetical protein [Verrucomicrobiales bacterium]